MAPEMHTKLPLNNIILIFFCKLILLKTAMILLCSRDVTSVSI